MNKQNFRSSDNHTRGSLVVITFGNLHKFRSLINTIRIYFNILSTLCQHVYKYYQIFYYTHVKHTPLLIVSTCIIDYMLLHDLCIKMGESERINITSVNNTSNVDEGLYTLHPRGVLVSCLSLLRVNMDERMLVP